MKSEVQSKQCASLSRSFLIIWPPSQSFSNTTLPASLLNAPLSEILRPAPLYPQFRHFPCEDINKTLYTGGSFHAASTPTSPISHAFMATFYTNLVVTPSHF